jgi:hypothetical protein
LETCGFTGILDLGNNLKPVRPEVRMRKMKTTKGVLLLLSALLLTVLPSTVFADSGHKTYQYLVGAGPLCSLAPNACPDVASAPNGDMVSVTGMGTFDIRSMTATGSGTFVHKMADGTVRASGTWVATKLLAFHSFGSGSVQGLPSNFQGGLALIQVTLKVHDTPVFNAVLKVGCELGNPPDGWHEGIELTVQGAGINFNEKVSGFTLFILQ